MSKNDQQGSGFGCIGLFAFFILILLSIGIAISMSDNILLTVAIVVVIIGVIAMLYSISDWKKKQNANSTPSKTYVNFDNMSGKEFEQFCADLLKDNGYQNIRLTKGSGDHGVDILANKDRKTYAIQCKCYSGNIGNSAIQEVFSGKAIYNADIAVVMTNRHFTNQAISDARALGVQLWDRPKLQNLIWFANKGERKNINSNEPLNYLEEESKREFYIFPDINLLKKGNPNMVGDSREHLQEMAAKLQMTLTNFGVRARVTNVICGPIVTQYEIQPEIGVKVSKILDLADDIKLNLAIPDIHFEAPIPGKSAIGIEVPNKENVTVAFRDLIESKEFTRHTSNISFCIGKDIAGNVIVADIAKMPHLLIMGTTGSGKSVCINTIIMSILYKASPDDVKMIMIDTKIVELSVYNGIPHLLIPVVTVPEQAAGALNWAVEEMIERYRLFQKYGVRNLKEYNKKVYSLNNIENKGKPKTMPQIVIIVDELSDLIRYVSGDIENTIYHLTRDGHCAGIYLIITSKLLLPNDITNRITANIPSRIALKTISQSDSKILLGMIGAEQLMGNGDMLFYPQYYQCPLRIKGGFISEKEIFDVVNYIIDKNRII